MEKNPKSAKKKIGKGRFGYVDSFPTQGGARKLAEEIRRGGNNARVLKIKSKQYGTSWETYIGKKRK